MNLGTYASICGMSVISVHAFVEAKRLASCLKKQKNKKQTKKQQQQNKQSPSLKNPQKTTTKNNNKKTNNNKKQKTKTHTHTQQTNKQESNKQTYTFLLGWAPEKHSADFRLIGNTQLFIVTKMDMTKRSGT